jgi:hypothetical protein
MVRVQPIDGPLVLAYCGSISHRGNATILKRLSKLLAARGGRLDLYCNHSPSELSEKGLDGPGCRLAGFFPPAELPERLAPTAHALVLPASFDPAERDDMATLFPSKLADYTALGLPILIWGWSGSSAVSWAQSHPDAAVVITENADTAVAPVLDRLHRDTGFRGALASAGVAAGHHDFSPEAVWATFVQALAGVQP